MEFPRLYSPEWFQNLSDNLLLENVYWMREDEYPNGPLTRGVITQEILDNAEAELTRRNAKRLILQQKPLA